MGRSISELISIIKHYHLHFRKLYWKEILFMLEEDMYSDDDCQELLSEARADAEWVEDTGNFLWRPPDEDELYAEGAPDIKLGNLIEGQQFRLGIRLLDRPRNILATGGSGVGKSVTGRNICLNIDQLNQRNLDNPTSLIIIDPKPDYLDLKDKLQGSVNLYSPHHNLKLGLNGPTDVPPYVWIVQLTMALAARLGLIVSRTCLTAIIARLLVSLNPGLNEYDLKDPTVAKDLTWPPLKMVLEVAKKREILNIFSSKADYGNTLIQQLSGLIHDSGDLFDCCNGLDINTNIQNNCHSIFNVSNVDSHIIHIITDILIN